jgi:hypothetical protein
VAQENQAVVVALPAPTGGWNERDPLEGMSLQDAPILDNFFPQPSKVVLRLGSRVQSTGVGASFVETVSSYMVGTTNVLLAAGQGKIYSCQTIAGPAVPLASGFTSNVWQTTVFNDKGIWVNGVDQPQQFNGTAFSDAVYTGVPDDNKLIAVSVYRNRLYLIEKDTLNIWYGAVDAVTGALVKFSVSNVMERGGSLLYAGPWNTYATGIQQNTFVFITSNGEVAVYSGASPADTSWTLIGRYYVSPPIGFRSFVPYLSDQICMLTEGASPLSLTASPSAQSEAESRINDKISNRWNELVRNFASSPGWCGVYHPRANMFLFNAPRGVRLYEQHVQNVLSGSWCRFLFDHAECWVVHNQNLYYGDNQGRVIEADNGLSDLGQPINTTIQLAFNDCGAPDVEKRFLMAQPVIRSTYPVEVILDVDLDLKITPTALQGGVTTLTDATPWMSPWMSPWSNSGVVATEWQGIYGVGTTASLKTSFPANNIAVEFSTFRIMYEPGGIL